MTIADAAANNTQGSDFRRQKSRVFRHSHKSEFFFGDRYSPWILVLTVVLIALSLIDGFFTLYLLEHGATELNPVMAYFINKGPIYFMLAKYCVTCVGVLCLLITHNPHSRTFNTKVVRIFSIFIAIYIIAIAWQIFMRHIIVII